MEEEQNQREAVIVKTSVIGISANVILAAFKAFVGILTNSIAVTLDAVNNLSDAVSSIITILGTKLSNKAPDKKHPFGYGRIEYLSQLIIAAIVLYAGTTSLIESVKKIIHPQSVTYTAVSFIILASAIIVKLILGSYVKKKGKEVNSGSLIASGTDAMFDSVLSISVVVSVIIYIFTNIQLEAWVGAVISCIIIKSGIEIISDAVDEMVGVRSEKELTKALKATITKEDAVQGVYDVIINNYGPDRYLASAHVEIPDTMTANEIDLMTRRIQDRVYKEHSVVLSALGIYAIHTGNNKTRDAFEKIRHIVMEEEGVLQMHGFSYDEEEKRIVFDIVVDFDVEDRHALSMKIKEKIAKLYPDYRIHITLDSDYSDL